MEAALANLDLEKTSLRNTLPRVFEIHILARVNITQRKLTVKDFLDSRSGYWALVWLDIGRWSGLFVPSN